MTADALAGSLFSREERFPGLRPTPPLSVEGSREVLEEMARPPADTPGRRATFNRARAMRPNVERLFQAEKLP